MTKLYGVTKHNSVTEQITFVLGSIALILVIISLSASFYLAINTSKAWHQQATNTEKKQHLARQIHSEFTQISELNNSQRNELQDKVDKIKAHILSLQALPKLSMLEGKSLISIRHALDTAQTALLNQTNNPTIFNVEELDLIDQYGQQQALNLIEFVKQQAQQAREQRQQSLSQIKVWLAVALCALPFALYLLVRYYLLQRRYRATVDYVPTSSYDMAKIFSNLPEATFVLDIAGNIIYVNNQACEYANYTAAQLAPMHFGQLIDNNDISLFEQKIQESVSGPVTEVMVNFHPCDEARVSTKLKIATHKINDVSLILVTLSSIANQQANLEKLRQSKQLINTVEQINQVGSWRWDFTSDELYWSDHVYHIYGYHRQELNITNEILLSLIPLAEREQVSNAMNEAVIFGKPYDLTHHIVKKEGNEVLVRQQAVVLRDQQSKPVSMIGTISLCDNPDLPTAYSQIFTNAKDAMVLMDEEGIICQVNSAFTEVTGFSSGDVIGQPISQISRGAYFDESIYNKIWNQLRATNQWQGELWNTKANGIVYPTYQYFSRLQSNDDVHYFCSFSDISEQKHIADLLSNNSIERQTKLPSRNVLFDRISQAIKRHERDNKSTVVILLCLETTDEPSKALLNAVSGRLKEITRSHDSIARFGLYEFIIVLEGVANPEDAYIVSEKISKSFNSPFSVGKEEHHLACNIGIAMHPLHSANDVLLLNYADAAMQYAKANSENNIQVFNEHILKDYNETQHLNNQLQRAIDLKELSVQFQPIMALAEKSVSIAIAHIRWHHAAYNNTQTYKFIEAAKNGKLREPLHFWLLNNALEQATQWPNHNLESIKLQIKVVKEQLRKPGLTDTIKSLLGLYHYAPNRLILEIEATSIAQLNDIAKREIKSLQQLGIAFNVSSLDEQPESAHDAIAHLAIDTVTSLKRSLTDTNQGSKHIEVSEKLMTIIDENSIYPPRQPWVKNACTINIAPPASNERATFLVCDSVPNEKLIMLAHLLKTRTTVKNNTG